MDSRQLAKSWRRTQVYKNRETRFILCRSSSRIGEQANKNEVSMDVVEEVKSLRAKVQELEAKLQALQTVSVHPTEALTAGSQKLWYPSAIRYGSAPTHGLYPKDFPFAAVVHYTGGAFANGVRSAKNSVDWGISQGFGFMTIAIGGEILQSAPLNRWSSHCGISSWPGLGSGLSNKTVGIEICNAG